MSNLVDEMQEPLYAMMSEVQSKLLAPQIYNSSVLLPRISLGLRAGNASEFGPT